MSLSSGSLDVGQCSPMPSLMNSNFLGSTQNQDHSVFPFLWLACYTKTMSSGFIYITSNKIFFVWSWIMLQCICTHIRRYIFFLSSHGWGVLGLISPHPDSNNKHGLQMSFGDSDFISFGCAPRYGVSGQQSVCFLNWWNFHNLF